MTHSRSVRSPEEVVAAYFAAMDARDADGVVALFAEDGVHEDVPYGLPVGRLRLSQTLPAFFAAYPDLHYACRRLIGSGDVLAAEYEVTHRPAVPDWRLRGVGVFELRDGLIVRHTDYWDERTLRRGLGGG